MLLFVKNKIVASFSRDESFVKDKLKGIKSKYSEKLMIFSMSGDYNQLLEKSLFE